MIKKQPVGIWINVIAAILTLISLIVYGVNISSEGYFKNASVGNLIAYCTIAAIMLGLVIVLGQLKFDGTYGILVEVVSGILRIAVPVLLTLGLVSLIGARAEGLGFIFFSNKDVLLEVQTAANLSSATGTIANMICLGIAAIVAMVASFFKVRKYASAITIE